MLHISANRLYRQAQKIVGSTKTRFIYADWQRIADYDGTGTLQNRYVYGTGLDEPLIQISAGGTLTYLHQDKVGSIIATTNSSGAVTNRYRYSPWGEASSLSGTTFGFQGQRFDSETGLYYMKARYFDPRAGRFLQPDPTGFADGLNLYEFARSSPNNFSDPLGLQFANVNGQYINLGDLRGLGSQTGPYNPSVGPQEQGFVQTNTGMTFTGNSVLLFTDKYGNQVFVNGGQLGYEAARWSAALSTLGISLFAIGEIAFTAHTHQVGTPGTNPYVFSTPDLGKNWPQVIVTSDGLIGYAPGGWNSQYPAGWFDFDGGFHKTIFGPDGKPIGSEVATTDPNTLNGNHGAFGTSKISS
jgi:RHS repeat-associated protein